MNTRKLEAYLDRYGARLDDWPADAAGEARAFLMRSEEARRCYGSFMRIVALLDASRPKPDSLCAMRVVARALREIRQLPPRPTLADRLAGGLRRLVAVPTPRLAFFVVAATALGFVMGVLLGSPGTDSGGTAPHGLPVIASADDVLF